MADVNTPVRWTSHRYAQTHYMSSNTWVDGGSNHSDRDLYTGVSQVDRNKNPNYKIQLAQKQDASTYYHRNGYIWSIGTAITTRGMNYAVDVDDAFDFQRFGVFSGSFPNYDPALQDLALTRLKRKLKKQVGSFESLVPIAEIRDLRTTFRSVCKLTTTALTDFLAIKKAYGRTAGRSGNHISTWSGTQRQLAEIRKRASETWLTWNFGLRPLVSDIKDITNSIASYLVRQDYPVRLTSSAVRDWTTGYQGGGTTGSSAASLSYDIHMHHKLSYRYIAGMNLRLSSANNYGVADHFGLDLPSVIPAAWEATAFSWVFDYFTNVGEFLDDAFYSPPGDTKYVVVNLKYNVSITGSSYHVLFPGWKALTSPGRHAIEYYEFWRFPQAQLGHVGLHFRTADNIASYGISKILNLASILGASADVKRIARR